MERGRKVSSVAMEHRMLVMWMWMAVIVLGHPVFRVPLRLFNDIRSTSLSASRVRLSGGMRDEIAQVGGLFIGHLARAEGFLRGFGGRQTRVPSAVTRRIVLWTTSSLTGRPKGLVTDGHRSMFIVYVEVALSSLRYGCRTDGLRPLVGYATQGSLVPSGSSRRRASHTLGDSRVVAGTREASRE